MIERNSILSQWKAALLCSEAVKHGLVRGSWKRAETMIESWSVSFEWGTMRNWEGQARYCSVGSGIFCSVARNRKRIETGFHVLS